MCFRKYQFQPNVLAQILHLTTLIFSWMIFMCRKRSLFCQKILSQVLHLKSLTFPWTILMCSQRLYFCPNFLLQMLHSNSLVFFMNNFYVSQKYIRMSKLFSTNAAIINLDVFIQNGYLFHCIWKPDSQIKISLFANRIAPNL